MKSAVVVPGAASMRPLDVVAVVVATVPWLFPFTGGPSAAAWPWLVSATAGCLLACLSRWSVSGHTLSLWGLCIAVPLWAWISHSAAQPDALYLLAGLSLIGITAATAQDDQVRRPITTGVLIASVFSAVLGLLQYFGASDGLYPWVNLAHTGEAYANLRQTNQFATLCAMGIAIVLWGTPRLPGAAGAVTVSLLATGIAASVSRTGFLEGVLLCGLAAVWKDDGRRRRLRLCLIVACAYAVATIALPLLLQLSGESAGRTLWARVSSGDNCSSRRILWSNVLTLISDRPITGWGWGELDFAHFMRLYPGARFCEIMDNAHNLPLHLAVELGLPAALLLCAITGLWAWRQQPLREMAPERQLAWAMLGALLMHSLLEYPLWYGPFQIAFGSAIACLLKDGRGAPGTLGLRLPGLFVSGALLLGVTYASWDYWRASQVYLPPDKRRAEWREDPLLQARRSALFPAQAEFAELTLADVRSDNAARMAALATRMLHYSPEPRVVERLIESLTMLGRDGEAVAILARYRAAYPVQYEAWRDLQGMRMPARPQD